jgi:cytochrome P450
LKQELYETERDYIPRNDLLDALIDSGTYDEDEVVDELLTFFLVDFETSTHALETIVYLLDTNKEWKTKILKKSGSNVILDEMTYEDIS